MADFVEIRPEPTEEEREAVVRALADWLEPEEPAAYSSAWRQSGSPAAGDEI